MPQVVSSPPRTASLLATQSFSNSSSTSISFTVPSNSDSTSNATSLIWAYGSDNPGSSSSASIRQHVGHGTMTLALMTPIQAASTSSSGTSNPSAIVTVSDKSSETTSLSNRRTIIITHAVLGAVSAMLLLPLGILTARLGRGWTTSRLWFAVHAVLNTLAAILAAATAIYASAKLDVEHVSAHPGLGKVFAIGVAAQVLIGASLHWIKPRLIKTPGRGIYNYLHVAVGLAAIAVGFAAVYTGMRFEWPNYLETGDIGVGWIAGWAVVVGVFSVAYIAGLALLPKLLRKEASAQQLRDAPEGFPLQQQQKQARAV
ncbi:uncharacterized protein MKK02DRAFT_39760 [Dioszegia hungarica]|uniref:Cytochrome b561 domain-containing protein n=1 Tax=Dioszegia hungarica TaxID=4972 RepID=A0AA38LX36_9TREE|nr:uncharacterized protein MKK02DRAFT_39760 [Dioszegia hungarica]KAI9639462.1 hypothetical protein MKK02DRAFT_39760 [Dioszegia hungarica]